MRKSAGHVLLLAASAASLVPTVRLASTRVELEREASAPPREQQATPGEVAVSGPGVVEPSSEEVKIGSDLSGQLESVSVEEGQAIRRGQVLAVLVNDEYRAQVMAAEATLLAKQAHLRKVVNGARRQERLEAASAVRKAQAVMEHAKTELDRRDKLAEAKLISREELGRFTREYHVAKAGYEQAVEHHSLLNDAAREEDRASAEAELLLAKAQLAQAQARYNKTFIRSPINGTVLRKYHQSGESISNSSIVPDPVVTIGDKASLRVRVDVDEADIMKIHVGQTAYVTSQAFGNQRFWGHVVRIGERLGPKNIRTDEPSERVDTKILETLVELDAKPPLPVGLRVDAFLIESTPPKARAW